MKITLVRKLMRQFTDYERRTAGYVLTECIDGLTEQDRRAFRRLIAFTMRLPAGQMTVIEAKIGRMLPFHNRHFMLESLVFKAQDRFAQFDVFRAWLKTGAGFVEWHSRDGVLVAVPKSMGWEECDDEVEFRAVHDAAVAFLRTERASQELWPHLTVRGSLEMIHGIMNRMGE